MKNPTRITRRFDQLRREGRKGFIAYVTAGDPTLRDTVRIVLELEKAGVDVVELGIPFSDPLADGRVNQEAAARALSHGATYEGVLNTVTGIRRHSDVPLLFFSYLNPLIARDLRITIASAAQAGVDGFLILDLPVEESAGWLAELERRGLDHVGMVTPTSPERRIRDIVRTSSGFVYCVSREGVTGMQKRLARSATQLVRRVKRFTDLPVALGFGISTPGHARAAAGAADAVIVGSAIVRKLEKEGVKEIGEFVKGLMQPLVK